MHGERNGDLMGHRRGGEPPLARRPSNRVRHAEDGGGGQQDERHGAGAAGQIPDRLRGGDRCGDHAAARSGQPPTRTMRPSGRTKRAGSPRTSAPGPYPITCSGGAATNYSFSYTDGSLAAGARSGLGRRAGARVRRNTWRGGRRRERRALPTPGARWEHGLDGRGLPAGHGDGPLGSGPLERLPRATVLLERLPDVLLDPSPDPRMVKFLVRP